MNKVMREIFLFFVCVALFGALGHTVNAQTNQSTPTTNTSVPGKTGPVVCSATGWPNGGTGYINIWKLSRSTGKGRLTGKNVYGWPWGNPERDDSWLIFESNVPLKGTPHIRGDVMKMDRPTQRHWYFVLGESSFRGSMREVEKPGATRDDVTYDCAGDLIQRIIVD